MTDISRKLYILEALDQFVRTEIGFYDVIAYMTPICIEMYDDATVYWYVAIEEHQMKEHHVKQINALYMKYRLRKSYG